MDALSQAGAGLVNFAVGEPDQPTPALAVHETITSLLAGATRYSPTPGLPALRQAVAAHVGRTRSVPVSPDEVLILPGANPGLFFGLMAVVDPGDEVIHPNPGYPVYREIIRLLGATPVPLPLRREIGFSFDPVELDACITPRTRAIIVNSPHNPTGSVLSEDCVLSVAEAADRAGLWVFSDEVYHDLVFDGEAASVLTLPGLRERGILVDSLSKTYNMTGWRIGYTVGPSQLIRRMTGLFALADSCVNTFVQFGAVAAFRSYADQSRFQRNLYRMRRDAVLAGLSGIPGLDCPKPSGAFYVFPEVSGLCRRLGLRGAGDLRSFLLREAGVAVMARDYFGPRNPGETGEFIRLSYTLPLPAITQGLHRLRSAIQGGSNT